MQSNNQKKKTEHRKKTQHNCMVLHNTFVSAQTVVRARNIAQQAFWPESRPPSTPLGFVVFLKKTRKRPPRV